MELVACLQFLDPNGEGIVRYNDFLQVIAKRLQTKETVDQLLVRSTPSFDLTQAFYDNFHAELNKIEVSLKFIRFLANSQKAFKVFDKENRGE